MKIKQKVFWLGMNDLVLIIARLFLVVGACYGLGQQLGCLPMLLRVVIAISILWYVAWVIFGLDRVFLSGEL